jgi:hypothetical protein
MRGCVRTHQVRSNALWQDLHFKSTFLPFAHHVCCNDLHNTKYQKLYKMLVINAVKSLTNISKGGSNKQYLTPIRDPTKHYENYRMHLALHAMPDEKACTAFPTTLSGNAREWFRGLMPNSISTFEDLTQIFLTQFLGSCERKKPSGYLLTLHQ